MRTKQGGEKRGEKQTKEKNFNQPRALLPIARQRNEKQRGMTERKEGRIEEEETEERRGINEEMERRRRA